MATDSVANQVPPHAGVFASSSASPGTHAITAGLQGWLRSRVNILVWLGGMVVVVLC